MTGVWPTQDVFVPELISVIFILDCGTPTIPNGSLQAGSSTKYAGTATVVCDTGYTGGGAATCLDTGSWATLPTCNPVG